MSATWDDRTYDAVIVGARCAGASTAMLLARAGLDVLVLERSPEGSDALSTLAFMRSGLTQLARWGLLDRLEATGPAPIRTTTFHYGDESIPIPLKPRDGVKTLYAPRRTVLDPLLVTAAREAGAAVRHGVRVTGLRHDPLGRVCGLEAAERNSAPRPVNARLVIGADGIHSTIAALAGAKVEHSGRHAAAVMFQLVGGLGLDGYHWYYRPGASAGVIPTHDGLSVVFAAWPAARFAGERARGLESVYAQALEEADPALARAALGRPAGPIRAFGGQSGFLRRAFGPGWALAGDAGCFRDPLTAHGMSEALRDAELLARAVLAGTDAALERYQQARDAASLELMRLSDVIASFEWTLAQVQEHHLALARLMNRNLDALMGLPPDRLAPVALPSAPEKTAKAIPAA